MKVRTEARREAILEVASQVFLEFGYERASMAEIVKRIRKMKMQVMPAATFAPLLVGAGVILGGEAHQKVWGLGGWPHLVLSGAGLLLNLWAFPIEYRCLVANLELLREVDERMKRELAPGLYHE